MSAWMCSSSDSGLGTLPSATASLSSLSDRRIRIILRSWRGFTESGASSQDSEWTSRTEGLVESPLDLRQSMRRLRSGCSRRSRDRDFDFDLDCEFVFDLDREWDFSFCPMGSHERPRGDRRGLLCFIDESRRSIFLGDLRLGWPISSRPAISFSRLSSVCICAP